MAESSSTATSLPSSDLFSSSRSTSLSTSFTSRSSSSLSSSSSIRSITPVPVPSGFDLNLIANISASDNSTTTATSLREASTPPHDDHPGTFDEDAQQDGLLNYYFVFLAIFVALVFLGFYLVHRRKQRRKQRLLERGQHALARDLEGWTSRRRWYQGGWRGGDGDPSAVSGTRPDPVDGLNELGEAPPPYKASENRAESRTGARPGTAERNEEIELVARPGASHVRQASLPPDYAVSTASRSTVGGGFDGGGIGR